MQVTPFSAVVLPEILIYQGFDQDLVGGLQLRSTDRVTADSVLFAARCRQFT